MSEIKINLPATSFPMKANLPTKEPEILKFWEQINLYEELRSNSKGREKFILHDGPPYANANSIVGSIGVIYSGFGFQELIKKIGVQRRVHTAGESKNILDPFLEEKKEDIEKLKSLQKDLHEEFINLVKNSRKDKIKSENYSMLFSGEFWSGKKSLRNILMANHYQCHVLFSTICRES